MRALVRRHSSANGERLCHCQLVLNANRKKKGRCRFLRCAKHLGTLFTRVGNLLASFNFHGNFPWELLIGNRRSCHPPRVHVCKLLNSIEFPLKCSNWEYFPYLNMARMFWNISTPLLQLSTHTRTHKTKNKSRELCGPLRVSGRTKKCLKIKSNISHFILHIKNKYQL